MSAFVDARECSTKAGHDSASVFSPTVLGWSGEPLFHEHSAGDAGVPLVSGICPFARDGIARAFVQVPSAIRRVRVQRQAGPAQSRRFFVGPGEEPRPDTFAAPRRVDMEFGEIERIGRRREIDALPGS